MAETLDVGEHQVEVADPGPPVLVVVNGYSPKQLGTPETRAGSMAAANEWWRQKQEEIDRAGPFVKARADLEAIKDQIDDCIYKILKRWIDTNKPEYLRGVQEKIEFLKDRKLWDDRSLPEEGPGSGLHDIV